MVKFRLYPDGGYLHEDEWSAWDEFDPCGSDDYDIVMFHEDNIPEDVWENQK